MLRAVGSYVVDVSLVAGEVRGRFEPGHRFCESPSKSFELPVAGRPTQQAASFLVRGPKSLDFAERGAQSLLVRLDLDLGAHDRGDFSRGVSDRDLVVAAEVDDLTDRFGAAQRGDESRHRVGDVVEIASGMYRAEADAPLALGYQRDDGRNDRPSVLPRSVRVERPQNRDRRSERPME